MSEMTLAEMAREIERRRPHTLPRRGGGWMEHRLIDVIDGNIHIIGFGDLQEDDRGILEDGLAHCVLRDAMVMATMAECLGTGWSVITRDKPRGQNFYNADHDNCPTRALFAAFCAVFPEPTS